MGFKQFLKEEDNTNIAITDNIVDNAVDNDTVSSTGKTDKEYFNMINEETGNRWNSSMLDQGDPGYFYKNVNYMQLKERSPMTFDKLMQWD